MINVKVQCVATLLFPTSIYAFYRIKKLRWGILIMITMSILSMLGGMVCLEMLYEHKVTTVGFIYGVSTIMISYILPIYFIRIWTIEFNSLMVKY